MRVCRTCCGAITGGRRQGDRERLLGPTAGPNLEEDDNLPSAARASSGAGAPTDQQELSQSAARSTASASGDKQDAGDVAQADEAAGGASGGASGGAGGEIATGVSDCGVITNEEAVQPVFSGPADTDASSRSVEPNVEEASVAADVSGSAAGTEGAGSVAGTEVAGASAVAEGRGSAADAKVAGTTVLAEGTGDVADVKVAGTAAVAEGTGDVAGAEGTVSAAEAPEPARSVEEKVDEVGEVALASATEGSPEEVAPQEVATPAAATEDAETPAAMERQSLSHEEKVGRIREIFELCDPGETGKVTVPGLAAVLTKHPQHAHFMGVWNQKATGDKVVTKRLTTTLAAENLLRRMDADHNGTCDWDEFLAFVLAHGDLNDAEEEEGVKESSGNLNLSEKDAQRVKEIFDMCDANRKGVIKLQGLMAVCTKTPQHAEFLFGRKRVKWDRIFKEMDEDGSNTISWTEFVSYISAARAARFYADNETTDESFRDHAAENDPEDAQTGDDLDQRATDLVKALEDRGSMSPHGEGKADGSIDRVVSDSDWHSIGESQDLDEDATPAGSEVR
eukprot:CAMPEP_0194540236 /NCGR_PEP_ID=MMETSP0253-20130528/80406_1 /TAXON_ID=2966 /ORGANISM="Noctiluca scintillans" /LENGTH=565 /DNA_ID=CAMNT_0039386589 /DNA_START=50 /DNA_END=1747 /DNA_ORIENTATION=+